jgi:NTE family protein
MSRRPKIGLALGGGGARGLAHIGVLKVLEREGIPIDLIVGTSMGAGIGAAYAIEPDGMALERRVSQALGPDSKQNTGLRLLETLHWGELSKSVLAHRLVEIAKKEMFLSLALLRKAILSEKDIRRCVGSFLPDIDLGGTAIPLAVTAVDLVSGQQVVLDQGPVVPAVMASCAVPGFMPPVLWNGMILVDGGVEGAVPARPAKDGGADIVIGVDVGSCLQRPCAIADGIDVVNRATEVMSFYLNRQSRESADGLIEPDVRQIEWTDFLKHEALIREGERAASSKIEEIRQMLERGLTRKLLKRAREIIVRLDKRYHKGKFVLLGERMAPRTGRI